MFQCSLPLFGCCIRVGQSDSSMLNNTYHHLIFLYACKHLFFLFAVGTPKFTTEPSSQQVAITETAQFVCCGIGDNLEYLWERESKPLPDKVKGRNTNTLEIPDVRITDDDTYLCTIRNDKGSVESKKVQLTVTGKLILIPDNN